MTMISLRRLVVILAALGAAAASCCRAFAPSLPKNQITQRPQRMLMLLPPGAAAAESVVGVANSILVATIDSDIANIPENEFAPVFMGGMIVMFGGLLSALIVGYIVDSRNLYANIVADSYAKQTNADAKNEEAFWKSLSEDEKVKAREMLDRLKGSKREGQESLTTLVNKESDQPEAEEKVVSTSTKTIVERKVAGMFSDYGDD
jgi:hypothetical protein